MFKPHIRPKATACAVLTTGARAVTGVQPIRLVAIACDTYMIMDVIHDWDDDRAAAILSAVHNAASPQTRLLLIEAIIPDVPRPDWSKTLDIVMLILPGGRQRTRSEHESLLHTAGFRLERVIPTASDVSILEAVPA